MTKSLPDNWVITTIEQLSVRVQYGYTAKTSDIDTGCKYLRITDIRNNNVNWDTVPFCKIDDNDIEKFKLEEGDLVFARTGSSVGSSYLIKQNNETAVFASYLIRVVLNKLISKKYIYYFFQSKNYWEQIIAKKSGVAQPNVNATKLSKIILPFPPYNEQVRIVQKINILFEDYRKAKKIIEEVPKLIDVFIEKILGMAFSGKLTKKWKIKNGVKSTFVNTKIKSISSKIQYGFSAKSFQIQSKSDVKYLRITDIQNKDVEWDTVPFCNISDEKLEKYTLKEGDLIFARTGATVGKSFLIKGKIPKSVFASYLIRIVLEENISNEYIFLFFQSRDYWNQVTKNKSGIAQPNVNSTKLGNIEIPIPSYEEQKEIISKINFYLSFIEKIKQSYEKVKIDLEELPKTILSKAFSGKLVSQIRNDENASLLLEKIEIEKRKIELEFNEFKKLKTNKQNPKKRKNLKMKILELLQKNKRMTADEIWQNSIYYKDKDIDGFYSSLRNLVEIKKTVVEVREDEEIYLKLENEN